MMKHLLHTLVAKPLVYDTLQRAVGRDYILRKLRPHFAVTGGSTVLDIGAGTGLYRAAFPRSARYVWLDNDAEKLGGFLARAPHHPTAMLGDATQIGLASKSVDYVTCMFVTHHLTDDLIARFFAEIARVVRRRFFLLDGLATDRPVSKLLWKYDRGSAPRTEEALTQAFESRFTVDCRESFAVYHRYLLLSGAPR